MIPILSAYVQCSIAGVVATNIELPDPHHIHTYHTNFVYFERASILQMPRHMPEDIKTMRREVQKIAMLDASRAAFVLLLKQFPERSNVACERSIRTLLQGINHTVVLPSRSLSHVEILPVDAHHNNAAVPPVALRHDSSCS